MNKKPYGPVPVSRIKPEAKTIFEVLAAGRPVHISRYGQVVAVIDPPAAIPQELLADYALGDNVGLPELTATEINQGAPTSAVLAVAAQGPRYVTRERRVRGLLRRVTESDLATSEPSYEQLAERERRLAEYLETHADTDISALADYGDQIDQELGISQGEYDLQGGLQRRTHRMLQRVSGSDQAKADLEVDWPRTIVSEATEAAAGMLPMDMVNAVAELADPVAVAREMPWLAEELTKIALGQSDIAPDQRDQRFADEAWRTVPYFRVLGQSYRLFEMWMNRMYESAGGSWQDKARARFAADVISAALSPTNYLGTNPQAIRGPFQTSGLSLVEGAENMLNDLTRGGMPSMVDHKQFTVGKDIAATPGAVVYRDEILELLQYKPTTPKVRAIPLLMIPPQINRHYIMDLSPGRSLVEHAVSQGVQTFMIVWRNPDALRGDGKWGLDEYIAAAERAAEVVRKIARTEKVNFLGLCAGGITLSYLLAHLATTGDESANSATFVVTMVTGEKPNIVGMLDTAESRKVLEKAAAAEQIVPGTALRSLFAMLRPNNLVYNYLVSGWLMGKSPAPFDVLAWNDDATRTTAKFALESSGWP